MSINLAQALSGGEKIIRPSSLPGWPDCARRTAARLFPDLIQSAGYRLRRLDQNVGAAVGTGVHAGAKFTLQCKMEAGDLGPEDEAVDRAWTAFKEDIKDGISWDNLTANPDTAQDQIVRMLGSYREFIAPKLIHIEAVEERLEADVGHGFVISGQKDVACREPGTVRDTKTGRMRRANTPQYGAYSLIERSYQRQVDKLIEDFIPRATLRKEQPAPQSFEYSPSASEQHAVSIIADIKRSITRFLERMQHGKAPPEGAFMANPMSMLCSEKYCPAWGTNFCRVHKTD